MTILAVISCGKNESDNIYKTKAGEYASKTGNFVADFPTEPKHTAIDNKIGLDKFQLHLYRSTLGPNKIFNVEYSDYPEHMIKSLPKEQLFNQVLLVEQILGSGGGWQDQDSHYRSRDRLLWNPVVPGQLEKLAPNF